MSIHVLIADDEPLARQGIALRLRAHPDLVIVGEAADGREALERIEQFQPALVFLDIKMPGLSGIELITHLDPSTMPVIILTTAYDEYAVAAFEHEALDYLLKPIDSERFNRSVDRARRRLESHRPEDLLRRLEVSLFQEQMKQRPFRFTVRSGRQIIFVDRADVDWIEALGDYAALHVGGATHLLREPMNALEGRLKPDFTRIHRSAIVQTGRIARVEPMANRDFKVLLSNGVWVTGSRSYKKNLHDLLASHINSSIPSRQWAPCIR